MQITRITNPEQKFSIYGYINSKSFNQSPNGEYPMYKTKFCRDTVSFTGGNIYEDKMYAELDRRKANRTSTRFHCIPAYIEALTHFDVKDYIRLGGESCVFELNNGNILKFSCEEYPSFNIKYHAPEIQRGSIQLSRNYKATNILNFSNFDTNEIWYLIQKKGEMISDSLYADKLWNMAKEENLNTCDFRSDQFAYFDTQDGKVVKCVDLGCITTPEYPMLRDFKTMEKMSPKDVCKNYGILYQTLKKYFNHIFAGDPDKINEFVKSIEPRLQIGESIFKIMKIKPSLV